MISTLRRDPLLALLLLALLVLGSLSPLPVASYPLLVDWPTIAALTGLLLLTKGVEQSGGLQRAGHWLLGRVRTERGLALALVAASAGLSTVLTNDVALFVVVPLTLGVARITAVPLVRLVVFEALAVNAGSALTPIGNPQNLFLWQQSHGGFLTFTLHMLPLVALLVVLLLALTACAFSSRAMVVVQSAPPPLADKRLLWLALALYLPFLVLADLQLVLWALAGVALVLLWARPRVFVLLDWGLLLVFVLMFIDLRLLAGLEPVRSLVAGVGLGEAQRLYWAGIVASQFISNVPAAIALAEYSDNWRMLAWAVNIGGFGLALGSLANLIALRMLGQGRAWLVFHCWSLPFLLVSAGLVYLLWL
ncbi:MAG: SLC13 family permease [Pseudomonadota bacterium]